MAYGRTQVVITHPDDNVRVDNLDNWAQTLTQLGNAMLALRNGALGEPTTTVHVSQGGTQAYGTATLSGVGGTAASGTATYSSASGTTSVTVGTSPGVAFSQSSGTDAARATALKNAITASTDPLVQGVVTATDDGAGVCTITAVHKGTAGNALVLTGTGTGLTVSGSGTLASGAEGSVDVVIGGTTVTTDTTDVSDAAAATACAASVNANTTANKYVSAAAVGAVVTVTALDFSTSGNLITFTTSTATGTAATGHLSGGKLSGGAYATGQFLGRP